MTYGKGYIYTRRLVGGYHGSDKQTKVEAAVWQKLKLTNGKEERKIRTP